MLLALESVPHAGYSPVLLTSPFMIRPLRLTRFALLALGLTAPGALLAQGGTAGRPTASAAPRPDSQPPTGPAFLRGIVFDSLTSAPLESATVVVVGTRLSSMTDAAGRFSFPIDSLAPGVQQLGFFYPALDSLGITSPLRRVVVLPHRGIWTELAVPSARTLLFGVCPDTARTDGRSLMMGIVRDANTGKPLAGARVVAMWSATRVGSSSVVNVPQAANTLSDRSGSYRLCGLPGGTRLMAQARTARAGTGWIPVRIGSGSSFIRNFLIGTPPPSAVVASAAPAGAHAAPDTGGGRVAAPGGRRVPAPPLGTASLVGHIRSDSGQALGHAQVLVIGTDRGGTTDSTGAFRISGLPAGTRTVEIRLLGFLPHRVAVDLSPHRTARLEAKLQERAAVLKAVTVKAARQDLTGFDQRRKTGMGLYLTQKDIQRKGAITTTDAFRGLPGVQLVWNGSDYAPQTTRGVVRNCPMQYYLNGSPIDLSGSSIDGVVRPGDIAGIEIYRDATETPVQYQAGTGASCGTVLIWTRNGRD